MEINVKKILFDEECSYKIIDYKKCCDEILNKNIPIYLDNEWCEIKQEYLYNVKLLRTNVYSDYEGGYDEDKSYYSITYCPFCQEEIEINIVDQIDRDSEYLELKQLQDKLNEERRNTDSKKIEGELNSKLRLLNKEINDFWHSDGFEDMRGESDV